jgi:hypothetical protein
MRRLRCALVVLGTCAALPGLAKYLYAVGGMRLGTMVRVARRRIIRAHLSVTAMVQMSRPCGSNDRCSALLHQSSNIILSCTFVALVRHCALCAGLHGFAKRVIEHIAAPQ